jgi:outer membrane protein assembly factor BamB
LWRVTDGRGRIILIIALIGLILLPAAGVRAVMASAASIPSGDPNGPTGSSDAMRTGWYSNQARLNPQTVASKSFGQLFSRPVNGQVYAQPLVVNGTVLVATETNWVYGLDQVTGAIKWSRHFGTAFQAADVACADLAPTIGVTSTPTVDPTTGIAYLTSKQYLSGTSGPAGYFMHAINPATGVEQKGFPVSIGGRADNNPAQVFQGTAQLQRPALLFLGGVVYAAFASHCDHRPYQGWVVGIATTGKVKAMWTTMGAGILSGAGIWQSGGGLVSDGPNRIFLATGNAFGGGSPAGSIPGNRPPGNLGESVVRLSVLPTGRLRAADFFAPSDAATLDLKDLDFGSGAPASLPDQPFGTTPYPHLAFVVGKEGYVYLLNRDRLGGIAQGPGGGDAYVARLGPYTGVWSSPAVWPGDGGYIYVAANRGRLHAFKFGADTQGKPALANAGQSQDVFGFGSGRPVVTSTGTTTGTSVVWIVHTNDGKGVGSTLNAYQAVPTAKGDLHLVGQWPIGTASKFSQPGVGDGRVYVGTRDGHVLGFGAPVAPGLTGNSVTFGPTVIGATATANATLTANTKVRVTNATVTGPDFALSATTPITPALPADVSPGHPLSVPVDFKPTAAGPLSGTLTVNTSVGDFQLALSGTGLTPGPNLISQTQGLSLGGTPVGGTLSGTVTFTNEGNSPLTIQGVTPPTVPFALSGAPAAGDIIPATKSFTVTVNATPASAGNYSSDLIIKSDGGTQDVVVTASATNPSVLNISPMSLDFGSVRKRTTVTRTFTLTNVGGSPLTIEKSKPPIKGAFASNTQLSEGTILAAGSTTTLSVTFSPKTTGVFTDQWIITANDNKGVQTVAFKSKGD